MCESQCLHASAVRASVHARGVRVRAGILCGVRSTVRALACVHAHRLWPARACAARRSPPIMIIARSGPISAQRHTPTDQCADPPSYTVRQPRPAIPSGLPLSASSARQRVHAVRRRFVLARTPHAPPRRARAASVGCEGVTSASLRARCGRCLGPRLPPARTRLAP